MKKGVRHTTTEIMAFIRKAEEVGVTAACREFDICYTTGRRWITNHSMPALQVNSEDDLKTIPTILEETEETEFPTEFLKPISVLVEPESENAESEKTELYREFGALILENERLKLRVRQLSRALSAMTEEA